jgi:large subunit ribosomal protein L28
MSKVCDLTGKKAIVGHKVSFSNKKSLRRFNVNLHTKKFWIPEEKQWITLKVSTSALRTISKKGINAVINDVVKNGSI